MQPSPGVYVGDLLDPELLVQAKTKCDPPKEFDAKGESTLTTRLHDTLSVP